MDRPDGPDMVPVGQYHGSYGDPMVQPPIICVWKTVRELDTPDLTIGLFKYF